MDMHARERRTPVQLASSSVPHALFRTKNPTNPNPTLEATLASDVLNTPESVDSKASRGTTGEAAEARGRAATATEGGGGCQKSVPDPSTNQQECT